MKNKQIFPMVKTAVFFLAFVISFTSCAGRAEAQMVVPDQAKERGLTLSDMVIRISSQGRTATFQLYDTVAARELYNQLPLELEPRNFRDAQWMLFLPQRLNVTAQEAYHDGIRGELSYYQPWGNAFTLYKDFYAGDQMHRLGINLTGIDELERMSGTTRIEKQE